MNLPTLLPLNIQKLGIKSFFDFCLKFTARDYSSTILSSQLIANAQAVLEVEVLRYSNFKNARVLCYVPLLDREIDLMIFNAKTYHKSIFKVGERLVVSGKVQIQGGFISVIQPKVLKQTGKILPNFQAKGARVLVLQEFVESLDLDLLYQTYPSVPLEILEALLLIFQPSLEFFVEYNKNRGFFGKNLEALKFVEIYEYMRQLKTKKVEFPSVCTLRGDFRQWQEYLPFKLTKGQEKAILEIAHSLDSAKSTRRVIVGDVGCGKTMVIFASVLIAYPKRSVLMVPTSILAKQIYDESQKYLPKNLRVALWTQGSKKGDLEQSDFVIGTHALLYQKMQNFALVMIDEQHRFGTAQRNTLERMFEENQKRPHILQFSATPIPRTLAMIESEFLDFSFILDLPFKKDITSRVIAKADFKELIVHIQREISLQHQVLIIYPLVEESKAMDYVSLKEGEEFWKRHFGGVYITHGKDKFKEEVLEEFRDKGSILLATTVVEVGISLPKLSTIVIVGAERLGLATLHQLRGRVSRNGLKGYCFLYSNQANNERLRRFCQIQSGFEVAQMDLEYRNSGDLLSGEQQSGKQFEWINLGSDEKVIKLAKVALKELDK